MLKRTGCNPWSIQNGPWCLRLKIVSQFHTVHEDAGTQGHSGYDSFKCNNRVLLIPLWLCEKKYWVLFRMGEMNDAVLWIMGVALVLNWFMPNSTCLFYPENQETTSKLSTKSLPKCGCSCTAKYSQQWARSKKDQSVVAKNYLE